MYLWQKPLRQEIQGVEGQRIQTLLWGNGDGPVIVACHDFLQQADSFAPFAPLTHAGFRLIAFDFPWQTIATPHKPLLDVQCLQHVIDHYDLCTPERPTIFLGWSWGTLVIEKYCSLHPTPWCAGVVRINPLTVATLFDMLHPLITQLSAAVPSSKEWLQAFLTFETVVSHWSSSNKNEDERRGILLRNFSHLLQHATSLEAFLHAQHEEYTQIISSVSPCYPMLTLRQREEIGVAEHLYAEEISLTYAVHDEKHDARAPYLAWCISQIINFAYVQKILVAPSQQQVQIPILPYSTISLEGNLS